MELEVDHNNSSPQTFITGTRVPFEGPAVVFGIFCGSTSNLTKPADSIWRQKVLKTSASSEAGAGDTQAGWHYSRTVMRT